MQTLQLNLDNISEKFSARERISLSENGETVKTEKGTAEVFNNFFGKIVKNLKISQYSDFDRIIENVIGPTLEAILKYKTKNVLALWQSELNVIRMVFLVLGRSVLRKLKQKLSYWNWIKHLNIQIYHLKLSIKTQIYFQTSFARVLTIP